MDNVTVISANVDSSMVRNVKYRPDSEQLRVEFTNGSVYEYEDVPSDVFLDLLEAPSIGRFINAEIKEVYTVSRVS